MHKDEAILGIRPHLTTIKTDKVQQPVEQFQNLTLRPLLKQQNDFLVRVFIRHINNNKISFPNASRSTQEQHLAQIIQKNQKFRQFLLGSIVAWFTDEEWNFYQMEDNSINKRIISLIVQRLQSQLESLITAPSQNPNNS